MTFINAVDQSQVPTEIRTVLDGADLRLLGVLANAQGAFRPWLRFSMSLLSKLELNPLLRELAILQIAVLEPGGDYEWAQHAPLALSAGATEAQLDALRRGPETRPDFTEEQAIVLRFTRQVVRDGVPQHETRAVALDRLGPRQVIELLLVIGQYMMVARIAAAAGLEPELPAGSVAEQAQV